MRFFRIALAIVLFVLLAAAATLWKLQRDLVGFRDTPFGSADEKIVEIAPGTKSRQVVHLLAERGALSDESLAWRYLRWMKKDHRTFKVGEYSFVGPLRPDQVLNRVYRGEVKLHQVTIPEGLRMDEIATAIASAGLGRASELMALMQDPAFARTLGVPFSNLEGFLFPDTYSFPRNPKPRAVLTTMVGHFFVEWHKAEAERSPDVTLDEGQAVTLASIIEKETGRPDERPRISCVFHRRLRLGMRLQTDPTVMYATMLRNGGRWSRNISKSDLRAMHPYNTYLVSGLPPGPIANPGAAALSAALHPATCNDLYFVSRNDGSHVFCPDLRCHAAAVRKWQIDFFRRAPASEAASRQDPSRESSLLR
ncbi:MAG TPA: endolytic transglycosylase MltG [Anaeromyxobacteraceae bacterium]|nr:endolytic transglycosylase MltG [Anaeromyxobacteraceae bacterium]